MKEFNISKREIKNAIKKAFKTIGDFTDDYYGYIMTGMIVFDIAMLLAIKMDDKIVDVINENVRIQDSNNSGLWTAIKAVCAELEQDHPGITDRVVQQFNVGYNACLVKR